MNYRTIVILIGCIIFSYTLSVDPDIFRSVDQVIVSRGFISERHRVLTDDGFYITLNRVVNPYREPKKYPVLIWHGIGTNSLFWLLPNKGFLNSNGVYSERNGTLINDCYNRTGSNIPFNLAACGYDVWLGNTRGNRYSAQNIKYSSYSEKYWNFTETTIAMMDNKMSVEYILRTTGKSSLSYIGHSMGTTHMFTLLSLLPSFERNINLFIAMAPITFLGGTRSAFYLFTPIVPFLNNVKGGLGGPYYTNTISGLMIDLFPPMKLLSYYFQTAISGRDDALLKQNAILSSTLSGDFVGSLILLQYGQWILDGKYAEYDYLNTRRNMLAYGMKNSPDYPLENIQSKNIALILGKTDLLADSRDVNKLIASLRVPLLDTFVVPLRYYSHNSHAESPLNYLYTVPKIFELLRRVGNI